MKHKAVAIENYLDKIPRRSSRLNWVEEDNGLVILEQQNSGAINRLAQILIKKPRISYIHLDELGSFIWLLIDGNKNIYRIAQEVSRHFGENAEPLYERLAKYFETLKSYGFVEF